MILGIGSSTCLAVLLLLGAAPSAAMVTNMTLYQVVTRSQFVFAGTIDSMSYRMAGRDVVTDIHFTHTRFVHGKGSGQEFTLTMSGGRMGGFLYVVADMPHLERGKRYVILATNQGLAPPHLPILEYLSVYEIVPDAEGREVVRNAMHQPLLAIQGKRVVLLAGTKATPPSAFRPKLVLSDTLTDALASSIPEFEDPGTRVTEEAFLKGIENMIR